MKRYQYSLLILLISFTGVLYGQKHRELLTQNKDISPSELQEKMEEWSLGQSDKATERAIKKFERWMMFNAGAEDAEGNPINFARLNWDTYKSYKKDHPDFFLPSTRSANGNWTEYSPEEYLGFMIPGQGRLNCVAFHPTIPDVIYVGAALGGLWRSLDGGATWENRTKGLPVMGVSSIVVDPTATNTIYIMTGDGDGRDIPSIGILKSTDGTSTWKQTALQFDVDEREYGYKILMHPNKPDTMWAATTNGIYRTYDGWNTMEPTNPGDPDPEYAEFPGVTFFDLESKPGSPHWIYAATRNNVYRTSNYGATWADLSIVGNGLYDDPTTTRIALAVTPLNPDKVFALHAKNGMGNGYKGLSISENSGQDWIVKFDTLNIVGSGNGNQVGFDLVISVDPADENTIYVGGILLFKSTQAGDANSWFEVTNGIHFDMHAIEYHTGDMYVCSDGGLSKSDDGGNTWDDVSIGLNIRMYYFLDINNTHIIAGAQDNGTFWWVKGANTGTAATGNDGLMPLFHPSDPNIVYSSDQGTRYRSTTGIDGNYNNILPVSMRGNLWAAPWKHHPTNHDTMYSAIKAGTLLRSYSNGDSSSWQIIDSGNSNRIRSLAQGTSDPNVMYHTDGVIVKRTSSLHVSNPPWLDRTGNLPVNIEETQALTIDPDNASRAWVVFRGYEDTIKVFKTETQGVTWTNFSEGLPNVRFWDIIYEPGSNDGLYLGSDIGVFYRNANMDAWEYFSNGLPNCRIGDLKIHGGYLYAATYANGVWRSELASGCFDTIILTPANTPYGSGDIGTWVYEANFSVISTILAKSNVGTNLIHQAGDFVRMDPGFEMRAGVLFEAKIGDCTH